MVKVDTSQARSNIEVLRMCLQELGWKECIFSTSKNPDIYWHSATFQEGNRNFDFNSIRVNKFPGMPDRLRKTNLTRSLNFMRMLFPDEFDFYPKTWFLPEENEQFQSDACSIQDEDRLQKRPITTFIVKPYDGSQGEGIYLIRDPTRYNVTSRPHIIQKYVDQPLLIDGLKFDIRIYVLILNLDPLEILLYDEGLARFATIDYEAPSTTNLHQTFMHLTNYSLNKRSASFKHASENGESNASKRKLSFIWSQLSRRYSSDEIKKIKVMITEMINKTVLAILPELRIEYASALPMDRKQSRCFQIIGFDVILTEELKPVLLEVNANPSLRIDSEQKNEKGKVVSQLSSIDIAIKKPLVLETLKLAMHGCNQSVVDDESIDQDHENTIERKTEDHSKTKQIELIKMRNRTQNKTPFSSPPSHVLNDLSNSTLCKEKPTLLELDGPITIKKNRNRFESSSRRIPDIADVLIIDNIKLLKLIYPSNSPDEYKPMLVLEKIALIYIELVIRRGYKTMSNRQFRNLVSISGITNRSITMPSIDMLYNQIIYKWKSYGVRSANTGLYFPAIVEAFFTLSQRKYPNSHKLYENVNELVESCMQNLNLCDEDSS